jgi:sulfotransferase
MKQFVCLSGLPRTGSTLLTAILSQNPEIHAGGNSAVCQLMWDMQMSFTNNCKEQITANKRFHTGFDIISQIPYLYYKDIKESIVVDKCRTWTLESNVEILKNYVTKDFKVIVLERSVTEIVKSFTRVAIENPSYDINKISDILKNLEPIMNPLKGIIWAKKNNQNNNFLFISYNDLVTKTEDTIKKIYDFCGWVYFKHDFTNVVVKYPEDDQTAYGLINLHKIRPTVEKKEYNVILPKELEYKCIQIDKFMGYIQNPL